MPDESPPSSLHALCAAGGPDVVDRVQHALASGANANFVDASGESVVHAVVRAPLAVDVVRALLTTLRAAGAELSVINLAGKTPLEVCPPDLADVVRELGGKTARQAVKPTPSRRHR